MVSRVAVLVLASLNVPVTDVGRPATVRATPLLKPLTPRTLILILWLDPPASTDKVRAEEDRLKLGTGMLSEIATALATVAEVPVTVTV